jgi:hypothetical protein
LDRPRVVLLAEASSGNSAEFRNAAGVLRKRGDTAFYCTMEQVADGRLNAAMDASDAAAFAKWKSGSRPAWFFLDSVDEARLNRKKFDDALNFLSRELDPALAPCACWFLPEQPLERRFRSHRLPVDPPCHRASSSGFTAARS